MALILALVAAAGWGSSDYAAGVASRRSAAVSVVAATHGFAALVMLIVIAGQLIVGADIIGLGLGEGGSSVELVMAKPTGVDLLPSRADLGWGIASGLSAGLGALLMYRGMAKGSMAVVAPITAVGAAFVPVVFGLVTSEPLGPVGLAAVGLALGAIVLVSSPPPTRVDSDPGAVPAYLARSGSTDASAGIALRLGPVTVERRRGRGRHAAYRPLRLTQPGGPEAVLSGLGFGGFFVLLGNTSASAGLWPVMAARAASGLLFFAIIMVTMDRALPVVGSRRHVVLAGLGDAVAAAAFLSATRSGLLSVVAVLSSLYPVATVGLARMLDNERCGRAQLVGCAVAVGAVAVLGVS